MANQLTQSQNRSWVKQTQYQTGVLSARYRDCLLGDLKSVALLLGQAPLIGWFCVVVWSDVEHDTDTLRFILSLAAVWFGCINACREIAKERDVLERERFFDLSITAYVLSKFLVLSVIGLAQIILLQMTVEWHISIKGFMPVQLFALFLASSCGTGLGLLVSAIASTQEQAVFSVPLLIIPQILFSEFAIPREQFGAVVDTIENFMPVKWAYSIFMETAKNEPEWDWIIWSLMVMAILAATLLAMATLSLLRRRTS
jgi:ABC transport system ATP-binding/permease protein